MARVLVHALGATAGGGLGYLRHLLGFAKRHAHHEWLFLVPEVFESAADAQGHVDVRRLPGIRGRGRRILFDQCQLRSMVRREQIDVILATGNFGLLRPPVPQVLLSRNALYFSREHLRRLWDLGEVREAANILLRKKLALASIRNSTINVVPSRAMEGDIRACLPPGGDIRFEVIPHGFDPNTFNTSREDWPLSRRVLAAPNPRILLVSHYNYFRNFETLIRAIALLRDEFRTRATLLLTTHLATGIRDHRYDTTRAAALIRALGLASQIEMLGNVPRDSIAGVYEAADVVACPSYAESFGHPLVEAMASGKPIVASAIPIHREICGEAALYFPTFEPRDLARRLHQVLKTPSLAGRLVERGRARVPRFSLSEHFHRLMVAIARAASSVPISARATAA